MGNETVSGYIVVDRFGRAGCISCAYAL